MLESILTAANEIYTQVETYLANDAQVTLLSQRLQETMKAIQGLPGIAGGKKYEAPLKSLSEWVTDARTLVNRLVAKRKQLLGGLYTFAMARNIKKELDTINQRLRDIAMTFGLGAQAQQIMDRERDRKAFEQDQKHRDAEFTRLVQNQDAILSAIQSGDQALRDELAQALADAAPPVSQTVVLAEGATVDEKGKVTYTEARVQLGDVNVLENASPQDMANLKAAMKFQHDFIADRVLTESTFLNKLKHELTVVSRGAHVKGEVKVRKADVSGGGVTLQERRQVPPSQSPALFKSSDQKHDNARPADQPEEKKSVSTCRLCHLM